MDGRPSESLMPFTRRLAEQLASEDGARLLGQLQVLGLANAGLAGPSSAPAPPRLGVWGASPVASGGIEFVRDAARADSWRFWADTDRIGPKRGPRVVLVGESAARGYLYDPALTPARLLETMLGGTQVLDLAASDLSPSELESVLAAVPMLQPDAIVVFAGNNWHNVVYSLEELQELAASLRAGGYAAMRAIVLEQVIAPRARATLDAVAAAARGVPVVVVVPEFALGEWREPTMVPPTLPGGANAQWLRLRADARRARDADDRERAAQIGRELIAIDRGTSPFGFELIGDMARAAGRIDEARGAFEAARDAPYGTPVAHSPRCARVIQDTLRAKSAEHGFGVVDLPRLFATTLGGELPDRRLFLDYCHLTALGMRVAMSAAAESLAAHLKVERKDGNFALAAEDEATAHLLAAIHNAHHGQPSEILRHHLRRAVELSDRSFDRIGWYLEMQTGEAEPWMCAAFARLCASPLVRRYLAPSDPRAIGRLADIELQDAMAGVLVGAGRERPRRDGDARRIDLLSPRHSARTFRERGGDSLGPTRGYHRAIDLTSRFTFHRTEATALHARLTLRLPSTAGEADDVALWINDEPLATITASREWRTHELDLVARGGANEFRIEWPMREPRSAETLERDARKLERAVYPDALPAYGEIFALTLTLRREAPRPPTS